MENNTTYEAVKNKIKDQWDIFKYIPEDEQLLNDICTELDLANSHLEALTEASEQENEAIASTWNKLINLAKAAEIASQKTENHAKAYSGMMCTFAENGKAGIIFMNLCLNSGIHEIKDSLEKSVSVLNRIHKNYNWLLEHSNNTSAHIK